MNTTDHSPSEPCDNFVVHPALVDQCINCGFNRRKHSPSGTGSEEQAKCRQSECRRVAQKNGYCEDHQTTHDSSDNTLANGRDNDSSDRELRAELERLAEKWLPFNEDALGFIRDFERSVLADREALKQKEADRP